MLSEAVRSLPTNTKTSPRSPLPALSCFWGTAPHTPQSKAAPQKGHAGQVKGFFGHFCNVLFKGVGSRGARSTGPPPSKLFPAQPCRAGRCQSSGGAIFTHVVDVEGGQSQGAPALYCVYILKKQSFVCFYYFNYCYKKKKSLPFLICGWGGFFFVVFSFSCLGGFLFVFCLFVFAFLGRNLLLVFVPLLVRTLKILKCFLKFKKRPHALSPASGISF